MNFTTDEKIAITSILIDLMNIDSNVAHGEVLYMTQLSVVVGIDTNIIEKAKVQDTITSLHKIRSMNYDKKTALTLMMIQMAKADGKVCTEELKTIFLIANICNLPIAQHIMNAQTL